MSDNKFKSRRDVSKNEVYTSSSSSNYSASSDDENDKVPLKAIKDYLSNRTELSHQLFKSVKAGKIRMMLPQILKKIDMTELEELCANELSGMSKSRILSILNGTPMSHSSDTSESDDSGPSLEIISDTEAWISDNEQQTYTASSNREKSKTSKKAKLHLNRNGCGKMTSKSHSKMQVSDQNESVAVKIKKEVETEHVKNQEGESLLDLLELEMRARAIKALIRKEEDIVSTLECEQQVTSNVNVFKLDNSTTVMNSSASCKNNEKIELFDQTIIKNENKKDKEHDMMNTSLNSDNIDDDQDVVMLVNPTPTINLLSSDSESDGANKQVGHEDLNKLSENRATESDHEISSKQSNSNYSDNPDNHPNRTENIENIHQADRLSDNIDLKHDPDESKECQMKNMDTLKSDSDPDGTLPNNQKEKSSVSVSENKSVDEEIIDLDDYPDDMDDIENYEHPSSRNEKIINKNNTVTANVSEKIEEKPFNSDETWATRYYQTDNVQSVMKESKIQSEIRKRLRERQKLSKLSTCPKNIQSNADANKQVEQVTNRSKLMGSVQEYLALEGNGSAGRVAVDSPKQTSNNSDNNVLG